MRLYINTTHMKPVGSKTHYSSPSPHKRLSLCVPQLLRSSSSTKALSYPGKPNSHPSRRQSTERKARISIPLFPQTIAGAIPVDRLRALKESLQEPCVFSLLLYLLSIRDAVSFVKSCRVVRSQRHLQLFKRYLRMQLIEGIQSLRHAFWTTNSGLPTSVKDQAYYFYLKTSKSPFVQVITQDAERTMRFVSLTPMSVPSQCRLVRVLNAVSLHRKELGYCQGMNYITAVLLQVLSEEEAFWVFNTLCEKYDFDLVFAPGMYRVRSVCNAINSYVETFLPTVAARLKTAEVTAEMYAARWVMTLFARELPLFLLLRMWDLFLLDGWKAVVRVVLAILAFRESVLLSCSEENLFECCLLSARSPQLSLSLFHAAQQFKVTRQALARLDADFLSDINVHTESTVNQYSLVQALGNSN